MLIGDRLFRLLETGPLLVGFDGRGGSHHKSTTEDVSKLLQKLKREKVAGIILDLRQNGGGSLQEAIGLTELFIKHGPVVQVKDAKGRASVYSERRRGPGYDGPMLVLNRLDPRDRTALTDVQPSIQSIVMPAPRS